MEDPKLAYHAATERGLLGALPDGVRRLLHEWADKLGGAVAVLSRGKSGWRFEAESFPRQGMPRGQSSGHPDRGGAWTGIAAGTIGRREWLLILPGAPDRWQRTPGLDTFVAQFRSALAVSLWPSQDTSHARLMRRLYAFIRKLPLRSGAEAHAYVLSTIAPLVSARVGSFALYRESDGMLSITATYGYASAIVDHVRIVPGSGVLGRVFSTGRAVIGRASPEDGRRLRYLNDSYLAVPLIARGRALGVIAFADKYGAGAFDRRDRALVRMFAAPTALAVGSERLSDTLETVSRAAIMDPVTGLFNRRHLHTLLEAEVQRARRQQQRLAVLMIDVDDFKGINDTFGHLEGDRLLAEVAQTLRTTVRVFDLCARYGGEEFAIIMPGASLEIAEQIGERVRLSIERRSARPQRRVTVSIGIGVLAAGDSAEDLLGSADRALISAKRAGKNKVRRDLNRLP